MAFTGAQKDFFESLMALAKEFERERLRALAGIRTREQVLSRAAMARRIFRSAQGLATLPPGTPLNPRVQFAFEREGYRVEHVIFESRPRYYVTANLYLPTSGPGPYPAALHVAGHTEDGKHSYHRVSAALAVKGIAVLGLDPPGQGERDEYVDIGTGRRTVCRACRQHGAAGDPAYLIGSNFGAYRLWDCMRSVDYLQSRPDIIPSRIGVTGRSGGGWESLWLGAIDTRIKAVSSHCYLTTFRRRMENRCADAEPDPEQDPFGVMAMGLDAGDLLVACCPRPVSLGVTTRDFFPVDGALQCYREGRRLFRIAGVEDRIGIVVSEAAHAMTADMRRLTYRWLLRWLKDDPAPDDSDIEIAPEKESTTQCTRTGIVELARLLRYQPVGDALRVETRKRRKAGALTVTEIAIQTSDGLWVNGHLWEPRGTARRPAMVHVCPKVETGSASHVGLDLASSRSRPDARSGPTTSMRDDPSSPENAWCRQTAESGVTVLDLDPRGMGPVREFMLDFVPLIEADLAYDAFLLGRTLSGLRVADILRGVDFLRARPEIDGHRVGIYGREYGALLALFSACLDERVEHVIEERPLTSFSSLAWHRDYAWAANVIVPDVLKSFDLEDVRASLAPRSLTVIDPLDHLGEPLTGRAAEAEYAVPRRAYRAAGADARFNVMRAGNKATGRGRWAPQWTDRRG